MKIGIIKTPGGVLFPAHEKDAQLVDQMVNGQYYVAEITTKRNSLFHRKVMAFLRFCYEHWKSDREFMDDAGQFEVFRKQLTCVAGYYNEYFKFDGSVRIEAKSISYDNMTEEEFHSFYVALTNAAMRTIFAGCSKDIEEKLLAFF